MSNEVKRSFFFDSLEKSFIPSKIELRTAHLSFYQHLRIHIYSSIMEIGYSEMNTDLKIISCDCFIVTWKMKENVKTSKSDVNGSLSIRVECVFYALKCSLYFFFSISNSTDTQFFINNEEDGNLFLLWWNVCRNFFSSSKCLLFAMHVTKNSH